MTIEEQAAKLYPYPKISNDCKNIIKKVREADKLRQGFKDGVEHERTRTTGLVNAALACLPDTPETGIVRSILQSIK